MKIKQYVRFVGYNKNSKVPTMSLNSETNKYCCSRCGAGGYSIGLYARVKKISNQEAYNELLKRECYSPNKVEVEISPINILADIELRDKVYRDLLDKLKLEGQHKNYLSLYQLPLNSQNFLFLCLHYYPNVFHKTYI